jgi:hypothetical protein
MNVTRLLYCVGIHQHMTILRIKKMYNCIMYNIPPVYLHSDFFLSLTCGDVSLIGVLVIVRPLDDGGGIMPGKKVT